MYDELIKALHEGAEFLECSTPGIKNSFAKMCHNAAEAIEELIDKLNHADDQIDRLVEAAEERRWIPVSERLPIGGDDSGAICENVCLLMDDGTVSCGWMNGITKKVYYLNARDDVVIKAPITRVTHWMPLPQPPKEPAE
jgi:hypothetical protein